MGGNANSEVSSGLVVLGELQMEKKQHWSLRPRIGVDRKFALAA